MAEASYPKIVKYRLYMVDPDGSVNGTREYHNFESADNEITSPDDIIVGVLDNGEEFDLEDRDAN